MDGSWTVGVAFYVNVVFLVHLRYYNKMAQTGWFTNKRKNILLTVLDAEESKIQELLDSLGLARWRLSIWPVDSHLFTDSS